MASGLETPGRYYNNSWPTAQETDGTEVVINRLQRRIDKLSITYDGLLGKVEKIERRFNRYATCVKHRNHVIDVLMLLRDFGGPHFVSIMVKSLQKFFVIIHEFMSSLDVISSSSDTNLTDVEGLDVEGPPLVTPGRTVSSLTSKNSVSLRRLLYQAQASALCGSANTDISPPTHPTPIHPGTHHTYTTLTHAIMERFDLSYQGLSYLKELLDFCGRTRSKMAAGVEEVSWRPLMCDVRVCVEVVGGWKGAEELTNILTNALRLSLDVNHTSPKEIKSSPDIDSELSPRSGCCGQEGSSPDLKTKQRRCSPSCPEVVQVT